MESSAGDTAVPGLDLLLVCKHSACTWTVVLSSCNEPCQDLVVASASLDWVVHVTIQCSRFFTSLHREEFCCN